MRKITRKNQTEIPASIKLDNTTTSRRRNELIKAKNFISENVYRSRYKQSDLKEYIETHYKNKCAYCEEYVARWDVEHYRPVSKYWWLAYSWDNLIFACPTCNQDYKNDEFELQNPPKIVYDSEDLSKIHNLCEKYNKQEKPKLFHPEFDEPEKYLKFNLKGEISSTDLRGKYTIKTCGLDRKKLNDRRKDMVTDDFVKKLNEIMYFRSSNPQRYLEEVKKIVEDFVKNAYNNKREYLGFRRYILVNTLSKLIDYKIN